MSRWLVEVCFLWFRCFLRLFLGGKPPLWLFLCRMLEGSVWHNPLLINQFPMFVRKKKSPALPGPCAPLSLLEIFFRCYFWIEQPLWCLLSILTAPFPTYKCWSFLRQSRASGSLAQPRFCGKDPNTVTSWRTEVKEVKVYKEKSSSSEEIGTKKVGPFLGEGPEKQKHFNWSLEMMSIQYWSMPTCKTICSKICFQQKQSMFETIWILVQQLRLKASKSLKWQHDTSFREAPWCVAFSVAIG